MKHPTEQWRPVLGYEGLYEVSQRSPVPGSQTLPLMVEVHRLPLCVTVSPVL